MTDHPINLSQSSITSPALLPVGPTERSGPGALAISPSDAGSRGAGTTVLELRVRNHPGTMSHVTGLFARRAFNLEAIVCVPEGDGAASRMLLLVADEPRLEQVERQLEKLHDVLSVRTRGDIPRTFFTRLVTEL